MVFEESVERIGNVRLLSLKYLEVSSLNTAADE